MAANVGDTEMISMGRIHKASISAAMTKSCPLSLIDIDALPGWSEAIERHLMEVDDTTCPSYRADERPC
jgi:hypothetical protein